MTQKQISYLKNQKMPPGGAGNESEEDDTGGTK